VTGYILLFLVAFVCGGVWTQSNMDKDMVKGHTFWIDDEEYTAIKTVDLHRLKRWTR
jgi:hypothetical protein